MTKLVPDGSSLAYSTYLGGTRDDFASGLAVNHSGEVNVVGYTMSADFPGQSQPGIIVAKLNSAGSDLLSSILIQSAVFNSGHGITVDSTGDGYITGAQNVPSDLYVAKISDDGSTPLPPPTATAVPPTPTPAPPTATPQPSGSNIHLGDLDGSSDWIFRKKFWQASVTIAVHDDSHNPVQGAVVSGSWSNGFSGSAQCTTGCIGRRDRRAVFTASSVAHPSFTYTSAPNHDPDGDSNGSAIIVTRP